MQRFIHVKVINLSKFFLGSGYLVLKQGVMTSKFVLISNYSRFTGYDVFLLVAHVSIIGDSLDALVS